MKKKSFTLIEVLISLGLLTLLLSTLFYWYFSLSTQQKELQLLQIPLQEEEALYRRLNQILPTIQHCCYLRDPQHLVFFFDRGVCDEPLLAGTPLGCLYSIPKENKLYLTLWPKPDTEVLHREPQETYLLLENISQVAFSFYYPLQADRLTVDPEKIRDPLPREGVWQEEWPLDYKKLPAFIKMKFEREARAVEWIFDLGTTPTYPKAVV